ncbi:MAG: threonine ammonia-lyase [Thermodesulfovibrionales bacterium]
MYSESLSRLSGSQVHVKCENLQKTGSFKVRGAFNKLLRLGAPGVVAASMGNHAQGVACAASVLGIRARIFMPEGVSIVKENAVRAYGAEVVVRGGTLAEALEAAVAEGGDPFVHPYDDDDIIAGQGTLGLEIMEQVEDVDIVLVPVGGGGLISGIALAVKSLRPATRVIGVQTEAAKSAFLSFRGKTIVGEPPGPTLADGIAVGRVGERPFEIMRKFVDDVVTVTESSIARAILLLLERKKLVVEGAGAVPLALLMEDSVKWRGRRAALVLSGGNIDFTLIDKIIYRGLVESGRIGVLQATINDVPGALNSITAVIAALRGNVITVSHDRLAPGLPVGKTKVRFTVEVKNIDHLSDIVRGLRTAGIQVE